MKHLTTTTPLSGDVSGTFKNNLVTRLSGLILDMSAIADNRLLAYNSSTNKIVFVSKPSGSFLLISQLHNTTPEIITNPTWQNHSTLRYTVTEAGNYYVKFTGSGRDDVNGITLTYHLAKNTQIIQATTRQFGAGGTQTRQIYQILATHYYFENCVAGDLFTVVFLTSNSNGAGATGSPLLEGKNLTVIKI
jgi:hypothetical protein